MLRDTTRRGLCVRVGPHHWHTNERPRRGGPRAGGASGSRSRGPGAGSPGLPVRGRRRIHVLIAARELS